MNEQPTQEKEFWDIKVKFKSYYKYAFTFGNDKGYEVTAGGMHDEVYRCRIEADKQYTIKEITDECGGSLYVYFNDKLIYEED